MLYFDLDLRKLVERPGYPSPLKGVSHKRGDGEKMELMFFRGATVAEIGTPTEMVYVVKESFEDDPPAPSLVLANTGDWTFADGVWSAQLGGDAAAILAFLDGATSKAAFAEFTFTDENGGPTTSQTLTATLSNDLWNGTEGTPLSLPTPLQWLNAVQAYDIGNFENGEGSYVLDRANGPRQYGMMIGNTTIVTPDNFEEGQCLTLCFFTNGGEWDLDFAGSIQMSAEAEAALPVTLPNSKAYIIELQMTGFLPVLTAFHGPTDVD
jgi:hypothetical protein